MKVLSWGANSYGQLGHGYRTELDDLPKEICFEQAIKSGEEDLKHIKSICGGGGHTLILTDEGSVYGFGWNNIGQLGESSDGVITKITRIKALDGLGIVQLASTWDTCYAITEDGVCIGWGSNVYGQLGRPMETVINSEEPLKLAEDSVQVACGVRHCIILRKNGRLLSSGDYKYGQLGRKAAILDHTFSDVPEMRNVSLISCGFNHTMAMLENGEIYGWGVNKWGQLGHRPSSCIPKPVRILSKEKCNFQDMQCGWSSSHLLTDEGFLVNFGRNNYGQLGNGSTENSWEPNVLTDIKFQSISVGSEHCLGLDEDGQLLSWGWNEHGSCGSGNDINIHKPSKVHMRRSYKIKYLKAAIGHSFAIVE